MISSAIRQFIGEQAHPTPYLVVDLSIVTDQYHLFTRALPEVTCHYSAKSNCAPEILSKLYQLGSNFEVASWGEIAQCLAVGIAPSQLHFGNSVKSDSDIRAAREAGVPTFAFDCEQELEKLVKIDPSLALVCRVVTDGKGAVWHLHDKFGCSIQRAVGLCQHAKSLGANVVGLSFHVGSQQRDVDGWCRALNDLDSIMSSLKSDDILIKLINIGGGFPASGYIDHHEHVEQFCFVEFVQPLNRKLAWLKQRHPYVETVIAEPGRFLVAQSGCIKTTVLLSTERVFRQQNVRWTYLDIGKFNGLYEATDVKLHVTLQRQTASPEIPMLLAGPSCDSDDILSLADNLHHLPGDITEGDTLIFGEVGAYSTSYASIAFNGIPPLKEYFI